MTKSGLLWAEPRWSYPPSSGGRGLWRTHPHPHPSRRCDCLPAGRQEHPVLRSNVSSQPGLRKPPPFCWTPFPSGRFNKRWGGRPLCPPRHRAKCATMCSLLLRMLQAEEAPQDKLEETRGSEGPCRRFAGDRLRPAGAGMSPGAQALNHT